MYLPAHFNETRTEVLHALMRAHPLATLVTLSGSGLTANHIPVQTLGEPAPWKPAFPQPASAAANVTTTNRRRLMAAILPRR